MKLLHISDLHIGKRVNEFSMLEDQKYILRQILAAADAQRADGVMIAGDIYDKPVPSAEAVQVFDWFLTELAERGRQVYAVSGNHDSAERIAFGAQLMSGRGVFVSPVYRGDTARFTVKDAYGELCIYLLPFIKPAVVRHALEGAPDMEGVPMPESYHDAVKLAVERMGVDGSRRNILIAHQFVTGAGRCDSEEVSVGGLDNVDADVFDAFDYVALGHIHSPQSLKRETVRYCGTPLKYSFSEAGQEKSVTVVELREKRKHCAFDRAAGSAPRPAQNPRNLSGSDGEILLSGHRHGRLCADYADRRGGYPGRITEAAHYLSQPDAAGI